jgi:hypothetical protein
MNGIYGTGNGLIKKQMPITVPTKSNMPSIPPDGNMKTKNIVIIFPARSMLSEPLAMINTKRQYANDKESIILHIEKSILQEQEQKEDLNISPDTKQEMQSSKAL